jgi:predicted dinucleotide-binding enzyme
MKIAIIGTGNVGGALATQWSKSGHQILLGVRDKDNFKGMELLKNPNTSVHSIQEAAKNADVILIAASPQFTASIIEEIGETNGKIVIDAMNSISKKPEGFNNSFEAILALHPETKLVKCFNSTGFENMKNPIYNGEGIDMFMAGDSSDAKAVAKQLALDAGFSNCYDFGGNDKVNLLEQFAFAWINLAIMQGHGRDLAFKLIKR